MRGDGGAVAGCCSRVGCKAPCGVRPGDIMWSRNPRRSGDPGGLYGAMFDLLTQPIKQTVGLHQSSEQHQSGLFVASQQSDNAL